MQIESFLILDSNKDILYCTHALKPPKNWIDYQDRLVQLLDGITAPTSFQVFPDIAVGIQNLGSLKLIVTAPSTSSFIIDTIMTKALNQFASILKFICGSEVSRSNLMERNNYIKLQMILQEELSPSGEMHFISDTYFAEFSSF